MKTIKKTICVIFCFCMLITVLSSCTEKNSSNDTSNSEQDKNSVIQNNTNNTNNNNNTNFNAVAYSDMRVSLYDFYKESIGFVKSEYNANGNLVRETFFNETWLYLPTLYIEYIYNSAGRLEKSVMYDAEDDYDIAAFNFDCKERSHIIYTYGIDGKLASGVLYENNKITDVNVKFEYHSNGTIKKRTFYEDNYLIFYNEYDEKGRCITESDLDDEDATLFMTYEGNSREVKTTFLKYTDNDSLYPINLTYTNGNISKSIVDFGDMVVTMNTEYNAKYNPISIEQTIEKIGEAPTTIKYNYTYNSDSFVEKISGTYGNAQYTEKYELTVKYNENKKICVYEESEYEDDKLIYVYSYEFEYDDFNNIIKDIETEYYIDNGTRIVEDQWVSTYTYDENSKVKTEITSHLDHEGKVTYSYERTYTYDTKGNEIEYIHKSYDENHVLQKKFVHSSTYDSNENLIKETETVYNVDEIITNRYSYEYEYDDMNNCLRYKDTSYYTDGTKTVSDTIYDTRGNRKKRTVTEYDENGNIEYTHTYEYDSNENIIE